MERTAERHSANAGGPKAAIDALAAIVLWSTLAAVSIRLAHVPPFLLVGTALLLGALCGARGIKVLGVRTSLLALGIYGLFAYHFCLFLALRLAPPIEANLINYLWPLFIVVLSPMVLPGTHLRPRHVVGALFGFAGATLVVTGGTFAFTAAALPGYALALAAALIWSTYSLMTKRFGSFPTSTIATFCLVSGLLSLGCHALFEPRYVPRASDVPYLLWIGVGPMGAAFYLWDRAMKRGDPRVIGTLAYVTPLLSTALVALVAERHLRLSSAMGMLLIVGGAALGTWPARARPPDPASARSPLEG
jgi:drug/metabolite transporter (DMT)-like permease